MASKLLGQLRPSYPKSCSIRAVQRPSELMAKRNLTQFQQQRKNVEQHAEETYITWKNVSIFVAVPLCSYLFYKHIIAGEHIEEPKEFVGYEHLRMRKKPFPWGDGDKSLFHNEKYNVGPDTDFEAEEEHSHEHDKPFFTRLIAKFSPTKEELIKARDEHLTNIAIIAVENLEYMSQPRLPPATRELFPVRDRIKKVRPFCVDE